MLSLSPVAAIRLLQGILMIKEQRKMDILDVISITNDKWGVKVITWGEEIKEKLERHVIKIDGITSLLRHLIIALEELQRNGRPFHLSINTLADFTDIETIKTRNFSKVSIVDLD